jgi:hypothetical protein
MQKKKYRNQIELLLDEAAYSKLELLIRCDIGPRSVERSRYNSRLYNLLSVISSTVYSLYFDKIKVLVDATVHSEHGLLI